MKKTYILVGAKPSESLIQNPGGQVTASLGLVKYLASDEGCDLDIIDTTQSSFPVPSISTRLRKGVSRLWQLRSLLRRKPIAGVVIFSSSGMSFYERIFLSILCRLHRVKSLLFVRSGHFMNDLSGAGVLKRNIVSLFLKIPDLIGAQGRSWSDFYSSLGVSRERIVLVRNWLPPDIDYTARSVPLRPSIPKFIYVGWLVEKKGIRELMDAVLSLAASHNFELTLVGGGDLEAWVRDFTSRNALADKVKVLGWLPRGDVFEHLKSSDVFVLPSKAEGFPNAMLEAMAMGLPAIVTDVGAVSDTLQDGRNGFLLEQSDASLIRQAMERYIQDSRLIEDHSVQALKVVQELHSYRRNCEALFSRFQ